MLGFVLCTYNVQSKYHWKFSASESVIKLVVVYKFGCCMYPVYEIFWMSTVTLYIYTSTVPPPFSARRRWSRLYRPMIPCCDIRPQALMRLPHYRHALPQEARSTHSHVERRQWHHVRRVRSRSPWDTDRPYCTDALPGGARMRSECIATESKDDCNYRTHCPSTECRWFTRLSFSASNCPMSTCSGRRSAQMLNGRRAKCLKITTYINHIQQKIDVPW